MYVGRKLGRCPWDAELRTLQQYERGDGNRTLQRRGGRRRGSGLEGIKLGLSSNMAINRAATPFAPARVGAWQRIWRSWE